MRKRVRARERNRIRGNVIKEIREYVGEDERKKMRMRGNEEDDKMKIE